MHICASEINIYEKTKHIKNIYVIKYYLVHKHSLISLPLCPGKLDTAAPPQSMATRLSALFPGEFPGSSQKRRCGIQEIHGLTAAVRDVQQTTQALP